MASNARHGDLDQLGLEYILRCLTASELHTRTQARFQCSDTLIVGGSTHTLMQWDAEAFTVREVQFEEFSSVLESAFDKNHTKNADNNFAVLRAEDNSASVRAA